MTGTHRKTLNTNLPVIKCMRFKPEESTHGTLCAIGCNGTMQHWDIKKFEMIHQSENVGSTFHCGDYTSTGAYVMAAGDAKNVYMYDSTTF